MFFIGGLCIDYVIFCLIGDRFYGWSGEVYGVCYEVYEFRKGEFCFFFKIYEYYNKVMFNKYILLLNRFDLLIINKYILIIGMII